MSELNDDESTASDLLSASLKAKLSTTEVRDRETFEKLSGEMLQATGEYIKAEMDTCVADYVLLEKMNRGLAEKYRKLTQSSSTICKEMLRFSKVYDELGPMLCKIEDVESAIGELERAAAKLDSYTKRLEVKSKQLATDKQSKEKSTTK